MPYLRVKYISKEILFPTMLYKLIDDKSVRLVGDITDDDDLVLEQDPYLRGAEVDISHFFGDSFLAEYISDIEVMFLYPELIGR